MLLSTDFNCAARLKALSAVAKLKFCKLNPTLTMDERILGAGEPKQLSQSALITQVLDYLPQDQHGEFTTLVQQLTRTRRVDPIFLHAMVAMQPTWARADRVRRSAHPRFPL